VCGSLLATCAAAAQDAEVRPPDAGAGDAPDATATPDGGDAATPPIARPKLEVRRFDEDWSGLRSAIEDDSAALAPSDRLKFVPLTPRDFPFDAWASFGGQARLRPA
jgi:hypothetical protein